MEWARRRRSRGSASHVIRVLIVGGNALTRAGLARLLEDDADVTVVAAVERRDEGAALIDTTDPHVVLVAGLEQPDAVTATRMLGQLAPVLLLTESDADDRVFAALRAGATGVLANDCQPAELACAVRTLADGGALLPPRTTRRLIRELVNHSPMPA
jgi:DNA-binding NarL/FixJ family response regulator